MLRGESFVSDIVMIEGKDRRIVPTHMLCGLAPGRSIEDLVQMAGRVTFIGRDVLNCNMGQDAKVKILISDKDWDLACAYYRFQDQLFHLLKEGKSIQELLAAPDKNNLNPCPQIKYDWSSDITAFMGKRTIGAKKRNNPPPTLPGLSVQVLKMCSGSRTCFQGGRGPSSAGILNSISGAMSGSCARPSPLRSAIA
jgi:hypothetical protein